MLAGTVNNIGAPGKNGSSEAAILVAVRVRPFNSKEMAMLEKPSNSQFGGPTARNFINYTEDEEQPLVKAPGKIIRKVVHVIDDHVLVFDPLDENSTRAPVGASNKRHKDIRFVFDRVYGEDSTQEDVYEGTTRGLLDSVMSGYNATVFAYGATGCGKTYTISGIPEDPGVIFLTMSELFERVSSAAEEKTVEVTLSYLEVYNEMIRDLLAPPSTQNKQLALREDIKQGVTVSGLSEHIPSSVEEVMDLMNRGNENRTMSSTEANEVSSRSHAVLQVHIKQKPKSSGLQTDVTSATLSIIDLAGSERATVARNNGARMREGANINRSLLALANCINALCDQKHKRHIPYRDSKLTRLLKFSLGGNCRTVMITCVSPASTFYEETHNTLKYANRAKNIKTTVAKNTTTAKVHLAQYQGKIREQSEEIKRLQREIALLKSKASTGATASSRNNQQAAQAMAELRKQTQAVQVVQDIRNKMSTAYSPIRQATWEHASADTVGKWYAYYTETLKSWREQFELLYQEQQHFGGSMDTDEQDDKEESDRFSAHVQVFRQQVDDLLRELTRERKMISRHTEHSAQLISRNTYVADRAAQVPPSVQLTAEQRYQVEQEHRVFDLTANCNGLQRQVEIGENISRDLAKHNSLLLKLTASCLCTLKRSIHDIQKSSSSTSESTIRALDQVYMQSIASFSEVTGAIRSSIKQVQESGGPSRLSFSGSTLTPPSPFVRSIAASDASSNGMKRRSPPPPLPHQSLMKAVGSIFSGSNNETSSRVSGRNPNAAAISAAVAGTTRTHRRAARRSSIGNGVNSLSLSGTGTSNIRGIRISPPKRSQAILGRSGTSAVRFSSISPKRRPRATTSANQGAVGNANSLSSAHPQFPPSTSAGIRRIARRNSNGDSNGPIANNSCTTTGEPETVVTGTGTRPAVFSVSTSSPRMNKLASTDESTSSATTRNTLVESRTLMSPASSVASSSVGDHEFTSPASSIASWASAESNVPHHEPPPLEAKPLKGILKGSSISNNNNGSNAQAKSVSVEGDQDQKHNSGPIRLGNSRRKSRLARNLTNPTSRASPTKVNGPNGVKELSFKSLGNAKRSVWR